LVHCFEREKEVVGEMVREYGLQCEVLCKTLLMMIRKVIQLQELVKGKRLGYTDMQGDNDVVGSVGV